MAGSKSLGQLTYEAYHEAIGGAMMPWVHLGKDIQDAWKAAAAAIKDKVEPKESE